jgi:hypothetical protein
LCPQCAIRDLCEFRDKTPPPASVDVQSLARTAAKPARSPVRAPAATRVAAKRGVQPLAKSAKAATRGPGGGRKR